VAARLGIPTVTTIHGPSKMGGLKGAFFEWQQRRNYRRFDAVVAVSKSLHDEALAGGVSANRLHFIPNAWSGLRVPLSRELARRELGLDPDTPVVGWVGRFIHVKGADVFLDALHLLPEPRPIAAMIGYGPEALRIGQRIEDLALGSTVRLYSDIRDAGRYYPAFDTYVLSSRSEGLPIVLLEAMAANTPIVATRVGGVPEVLTERGSWLVPPEDPRALAEAISASLRDRRGAAERARHSAELLKRDYSIETFLKRYEEVYLGVLRRADHRS
jgi:glycosyltransferase involved in cell wall biosynthesis